ncbi:hypothetical protein [Aldersonia kunmingensis]|uniref:hypothetical protein n=1 Tax=Aldersonia kunmingensis TaxID=408066 RepID=UPI000A569F63|nr:hypothetical protein [Aldersonia kunmingensis]
MKARRTSRKRQRGLRTLVAAAGRHAVTRPAQRRRLDEHASTVFDVIEYDRSSTVAAEDGVALSVREHGRRDAPITVLFVHGFANRMTSFHLQRTRIGSPVGQRRPDGLLRPARPRPLRHPGPVQLHN